MRFSIALAILSLFAAALGRASLHSTHAPAAASARPVVIATDCVVEPNDAQPAYAAGQGLAVEEVQQAEMFGAASAVARHARKLWHTPEGAHASLRACAKPARDLTNGCSNCLVGRTLDVLQ